MTLAVPRGADKPGPRRTDSPRIKSAWRRGAGAIVTGHPVGCVVHGGRYCEQLEEQARRKGAAPIASVEELRADVFDSDAELDEFLADL